MKKYYYVCPRCGRTWRRFFPRRGMKCGFCSQTWRTRKSRGTHSRYSATATLLWLAVAVLIAAPIVELTTGAISEFARTVLVSVEKKTNKSRTSVKEAVPGASESETTSESDAALDLKTTRDLERTLETENAVDGARGGDASSLDFRSEKTREKYEDDGK